jgi:hypothetical protein
VLLKVQVTNRQKRKVKVSVFLEGDNLNVNLPKSQLKEFFYDADTKTLVHLIKVDPSSQDWGSIRVRVEAREISPIPNPPAVFFNITGGFSLISPQGIKKGSAGTFTCGNCRHLIDS